LGKEVEMNRELRLKDTLLIALVLAVAAIAVGVSTDVIVLRKAMAALGVAAWVALGLGFIWLSLHVGFVGLQKIQRSERPLMFWASLVAWSLIWLIFLGLLCTWAWPLLLETPNNAINADSQDQRSFVALLLAAGYGER
jgi:amino acid transporter